MKKHVLKSTGVLILFLLFVFFTQFIAVPKDYQLDKDSQSWYWFLGKQYQETGTEEVQDTPWEMRGQTLYMAMPGESSASKGEISISSVISFEAPAVKPMGKADDSYQRVEMDGTTRFDSIPGAPVLPQKPVYYLIPYGQEVRGISVTPGELQSLEGEYLIEPAQKPVPISQAKLAEPTFPDPLFYNLEKSYLPCKYISTQTKSGYKLLILSLFPVDYNPLRRQVSYYKDIKVEIETTQGKPESSHLRANLDQEIIDEIRELVENPEVLQTYMSGEDSREATQPLNAEPLVPPGGPYEYVVITSSSLSDNFQPLVDRKITRGLTATTVTTQYIYANYAGTENGDNADKIRHFIADAYSSWGTQWVLLGGDIEVVPQRGVYVSCGAEWYSNLPTDMYYACLDGPWNNDGDSRWGEGNDGAAGSDVDLMPEVYVGRAPVSSGTEADNFVAKTIKYDNKNHPNDNKAIWLGEQLDAFTFGSYSGIPIKETCLPVYWSVVSRYDSSGGWSGNNFINDLNRAPNIINHLGHANQTYNARIYSSDIPDLTNNHPYFMYSQGCDSGSFDTHDISIAERHVVSDKGAFAVVMNARFGWYAQGVSPSYSHWYALEFWDAAFNEEKLSLAEANQDSKADNLFRVEQTGCYRWIHFETNLFGDPQLEFQGFIREGAIEGAVYDDLNEDGELQGGEPGIQGETVYFDMNDNRTLDVSNNVTASSGNVPKAIVDLATITSQRTLRNFPGVITDMNVTLNITHSWDSDLIVSLISPQGSKVTLFNSLGGSGDNFTNTTLDDEGSTSITAGNPPFSGTFRPEQSLSKFDGEDPNGQWLLEITDTWSEDSGTLNSWSMNISCQEPSTQTDAQGSYQFDKLTDGPYRVRHVLPNGSWYSSPGDGTYSFNISDGETRRNRNFLLRSTEPPLPDGVPSNLSASIVSGLQVQLAWQDNSSNEGGFYIERKIGSNDFAQIASVGAGITTYRNSGLSRGQTYRYRVRAYTGGGASAASDRVSITIPELPHIRVISPSRGTRNTKVTIKGNDFGRKNSKSKVRFYKGGRRKNASIVSWGDSTVKCRVPRLPKGRYRIQIINSNGKSNGKSFRVK